MTNFKTEHRFLKEQNLPEDRVPHSVRPNGHSFDPERDFSTEESFRYLNVGEEKKEVDSESWRERVRAFQIRNSEKRASDFEQNSNRPLGAYDPNTQMDPDDYTDPKIKSSNTSVGSKTRSLGHGSFTQENGIKSRENYMAEPGPLDNDELDDFNRK